MRDAGLIHTDKRDLASTYICSSHSYGLIIKNPRDHCCASLTVCLSPGMDARDQDSTGSSSGSAAHFTGSERVAEARTLTANQAARSPPARSGPSSRRSLRPVDLLSRKQEARETQPGCAARRRPSVRSDACRVDWVLPCRDTAFQLDAVYGWQLLVSCIGHLSIVFIIDEYRKKWRLS